MSGDNKDRSVQASVVHQQRKRESYGKSLPAEDVEILMRDTGDAAEALLSFGC